MAAASARSLSPRRPQLQVLRNQSVGSTWSGARLGPAVRDRDADQHVVGPAFAYSAMTSK